MRSRTFQLVLVGILAWIGGFLIADARRPDRAVVTISPDQTATYVRPQGRPGVAPGLGGRCNADDTAPDPTWTCVNSVWTATAPTPMGGVGPGRAAGCVTAPPANQYTCINGVWMAPGTTGGGAGATSGAPTAQGALPPLTPQCVGTPPITGTGQTVACENGVWVIR